MADPQQRLEQRFAPAIARAFGDELANTDPTIRPSTNPKFGDYQANVAMALAKRLKQRPRDVAQAIVDKLDVRDLCAHVEIAGPGFINLTLSETLLNQTCAAMAADDRLGVQRAQSPQTTIVDYSGPNLAKEMHVGHLRSTIIGDCLARVLTFLGHEVICQNHLGDWGTQFGMLVEQLIDTGWDASADLRIGDLNELYQNAQRRFDADPDFADRARKCVVALQSGDEQVLGYWQMLIDESIRHMNTIYERLGVLLTDNDIHPESFYNPRLPEVIAGLHKAALLKESRGAEVVFPNGFKDRQDNPLAMIVRKSDGGYLYATTDLAAARYRIDELGADRLIYVTDARQIQHFAMVFQTLRQARWAPPPVRLDHVPFGAVLGNDRRPLKTREGQSVRLADVLDEAVHRAGSIIDEKSPDRPANQRDAIARAIGIGAVKYADLSNDRIKDYVFDWDRMLSFEGNTCPYLQNAYVRIRSIFRKGDVESATLHPGSIAIRQRAERTVAVKLLQFPSVVDSVGQSLEPHRLCIYLYELATAFHKFYEACPVLGADDLKIRDSRLALCDLVARTLRCGLNLLGINVVEQM